MVICYTEKWIIFLLFTSLLLMLCRVVGWRISEEEEKTCYKIVIYKLVYFYHVYCLPKETTINSFFTSLICVLSKVMAWLAMAGEVEGCCKIVIHKLV